jgi:hypothetical protein
VQAVLKRALEYPEIVGQARHAFRFVGFGDKLSSRHCVFIWRNPRGGTRDMALLARRSFTKCLECFPELSDLEFRNSLPKREFEVSKLKRDMVT